jgi:hypothetical protein
MVTFIGARACKTLCESCTFPVNLIVPSFVVATETVFAVRKPDPWAVIARRVCGYRTIYRERPDMRVFEARNAYLSRRLPSRASAVGRL